MTRLERAILFATTAFDTKGGTIKKYIDEDGMPKIVHCLEVMFAVKQLIERDPSIIPDGCTADDLLVAAVLHDVVEDTKFTKEDIAREFGDVVAELVDGVSRREHSHSTCKVAKCSEHKEFYRDFIYRAGEKVGTTIIKIADLTVNRKRTHKIKDLKWRDKLEFKYDTALKVLTEEISWEEASWGWHCGDFGGKIGSEGGYFTVADPNGKKLRLTTEEFEKYTGRKVTTL